MLPLQRHHTAGNLKKILWNIFLEFNVQIKKNKALISDKKAAIKKASKEIVVKSKH